MASSPKAQAAAHSKAEPAKAASNAPEAPKTAPLQQTQARQLKLTAAERLIPSFVTLKRGNKQRCFMCSRTLPLALYVLI